MTYIERASDAAAALRVVLDLPRLQISGGHREVDVSARYLPDRQSRARDLAAVWIRHADQAHCLGEVDSCATMAGAWYAEARDLANSPLSPSPTR